MKSIVVPLSVGVSLLATMVVGAQEAADDGLALEEIVVTARRAEETLQKVPLSITALGSKDIQAMGIARVEDVAALTPGFSFRNGFGRAIERPVIRGMANISGTANAALNPNTGTMAGTIVDDPAATPLAGAWAIAIGPTGIAGGAVTAANGTYTLGGLATGTYRATFVDPNGGRTQEYWDNSPTYTGATTLNITPANTTTANAALHHP